MNAIECIKTRRSVRKFTDQPVTKEQLQAVVEAAAWAPSWKNTQTVRYTAVTDPAVKQEIAEKAVHGFAWNTKIISGAPVLVVLTSVLGRSGYEKDGSFSTSQGTHWQSFDAGAAAEAFCLAAHEAGLGSVILGVIDEEAIRAILQIPETEGVAALIPVGWPDESPKAPRRKTAEELLRFV
ncbi:MAG: nitroreductase family protein [Eubacterium sp.]|nr:nitroreductase family protein [Eubacterium sp.]